MAPGARIKFGVPTFESRSFLSEANELLKDVLVTLLALFRAFQSFGTPTVIRHLGNYAPLFPLNMCSSDNVLPKQSKPLRLKKR